MNAVLAIIANGGRAIVVIYREARVQINYHPLVYNFILIPSMVASSNPFQRGSRRWGMFLHQNHASRGENSSSWWGCLCDVCFASKKSSEMEFFVPARTHLAFKLLTA
jgi:hypothetical protein